MAQFRRLSATVLACPQISLEEIAEAKERGVTLIVNNRPDGEDPTAPQGMEIEDEAAKLGLNYVSIPIGHGGFSEPQIDAMIEALEQAEGEVLAYCRSGTRSTLLWSLAQAKLGVAPDEIAAAANAAGYDITPIRPMVDMLASR